MEVEFQIGRGLAFGFEVDEGSAPPEEYVCVEYIESTGTQYIVTDIVPTYASRMYVDARFSEETRVPINWDTGVHPLACVNYAGSFRLKLFNQYSSRYDNAGFYIGFGWRSDLYSRNEIYGIDVTQRATIIMSRDTSYWGPQSCRTDYEIYAPAPSQGLAIFGVRSDTDVVDVFMRRDMYLYGFKIYEGLTLEHDFVPAERRSDGELGLYDKQTAKFYANAGTGTFVKGAYTGETITGHSKSIPRMDFSTGNGVRFDITTGG